MATVMAGLKDEIAGLKAAAASSAAASSAKPIAGAKRPAGSAPAGHSGPAGPVGAIDLTDDECSLNGRCIGGASPASKKSKASGSGSGQSGSGGASGSASGKGYKAAARAADMTHELFDNFLSMTADQVSLPRGEYKLVDCEAFDWTPAKAPFLPDAINKPVLYKGAQGLCFIVRYDPTLGKISAKDAVSAQRYAFHSGLLALASTDFIDYESKRQKTLAAAGGRDPFSKHSLGRRTIEVPAGAHLAFKDNTLSLTGATGANNAVLKVSLAKPEACQCRYCRQGGDCEGTGEECKCETYDERYCKKCVYNCCCEGDGSDESDE